MHPLRGTGMLLQPNAARNRSTAAADLPDTFQCGFTEAQRVLVRNCAE